jgi:kynureninase
MAKRQKTMRNMLVRSGAGESMGIQGSSTLASSSTPPSPNKKLKVIQKANEEWKDAWYDWVEFNSELGRILCKICKAGGDKYVYANEGSSNIKISALQDHAKTNEHRKLAWAKHEGKKSLQKAMAAANHSCDEALLSLFRAAYFMGKETIHFYKFSSLCNLLISCKTAMTEKIHVS